jgi:ubiquinone/menaquinone biosynthesis C-methylase UbiE
MQNCRESRNTCLMTKYLSSQEEIIGLDISEEMISQFKKKCEDFPNVKIINARIEQNLTYEGYFDKAFISFVLHGFPQEARNRIIRNAFKALKKGGEFFILDYNEFSWDLYFRRFFKHLLLMQVFVRFVSHILHIQKSAWRLSFQFSVFKKCETIVS